MASRRFSPWVWGLRLLDLPRGVDAPVQARSPIGRATPRPVGGSASRRLSNELPVGSWRIRGEWHGASARWPPAHLRAISAKKRGRHPSIAGRKILSIRSTDWRTIRNPTAVPFPPLPSHPTSPHAAERRAAQQRLSVRPPRVRSLSASSSSSARRRQNNAPDAVQFPR